MKINWIEINLPWAESSDDENRPTYPDLSEKERQVFGKTYDEGRPSSEVFSRYWKIQQIIDDRLIGLSEKEHAQKEQELINDEERSILCEVRKWWAGQKKIEEWAMFQPEVQEYEKAYEEFRKIQNLKSFSGRGLNKSGTLIELETGTIELIGSINSGRGVCDDCTAFEKDVIVKRYAVIFELEKIREML